MKRLRITAIILVAAIITALFGCDTNPAQTSSGNSSGDGLVLSNGGMEFRLPYTLSDSFNPYTAETKINRELSTLLYDSLVVLDENMQPVYRLAESITLQGNDCIVKLRAATFSDGSTVTSEDVTSSIAAALKSEYKYKTQLANVDSYNAADSKTVTIKLTEPDPNFVSMLDFPVYKMGTENLKNTDNKDLPPIGSGRYVYNSNNGAVTLTAREDWIGGSISVKEIILVNAPDSDALQHNVESSGISMYYTDLSDGGIPSWSEQLTKAPLNNLVFMGVNSSNSLLENESVRRAISAALDRNAIAEDVFYTYAQAATGIYHPSYYPAKDMKHISVSADSEAASAELESAGLGQMDSEGYIIQNGSRLTFKLLVNSENDQKVLAAETIKTHLRKAGIMIEVNAVPQTDYNAALTSGKYDLYIGEVKLPKNMDMSAFFGDGGAASFGIDPLSAAKAKYNEYKAGSAQISDFIAAFEKELPIIPICYRSGLLCYTSMLPNIPSATLSDIYYNIQGYIVG